MMPAILLTLVQFFSLFKIGRLTLVQSDVLRGWRSQGSRVGSNKENARAPPSRKMCEARPTNVYFI